MSGAGFTAEFDPGALDRVLRFLTPDRYDDALDMAATDLAHHGEAVAKGVTPQVTGHARRSTGSDVEERGVKRVKGSYPYLDWLDTGEDSRGRRMQTRPGGYQIRRTTRDEVVRKAGAAVEAAIKEVLGRR